jgi:hypothetical protein
MEWVADYVGRPRRDVRYLVSSQCHDRVFEALKDCPVFLWHADQDFDEGPEPRSVLREKWPNSPWYCVPGPTTVGLRTPQLGNAMGADKFDLFGLDSSRGSSRKMHAYDKPEPPDTSTGTLSVKHRGKSYHFETNGHMVRQVMDFDRIIGELPQHYASGRYRPQFEMTVHGSGLLPFRAAQVGLHADPECNANPPKVGGYVKVE